ncbi:MAG: transcriptional repressor [Candidatus Krumholzibacteriia bacterium]|nr:transcriptional repressor [bacterium]MCB9513454.1 transcriptional repressor [Candidatus Latescibacterota bacterium]
MRHTRQRRAILQFLRGTRTHPTAEQTHAELRKELPTLSLGTVYRNLGKLVEEGLVRELRPGVRGAGSRYDAALEAHHHFFCTRCGKVEDVYPGLPSTVKEAMIRSIDRDVSEFRLQFFGICEDCAHRANERREVNER